MLLNVSQLLDDDASREAVTQMLTTQHAILLPINLTSALLNGMALTIILRAATSLSVRDIRVGSLAFTEVLCGLFGCSINLLYLNGITDCSANCELTFEDPGMTLTYGPGVTVTLLRYCIEVWKITHYSLHLINSVYSWILFAYPLQYLKFSRHRSLYKILAGVWCLSFLSNIFILVDGLSYKSDAMYFGVRVYINPVLHIVHTIIAFGLSYNVTRIAIDQVRATAKLADLQARLHPLTVNNIAEEIAKTQKRRRLLFKKNLHIIHLFLLSFGGFLVSASPMVYFRAFRPRLPATRQTVATLLALDILPSLHYLFTFLLIARLNPVVRDGLRDLTRSVCSDVSWRYSCFWLRLRTGSGQSIDLDMDLGDRQRNNNSNREEHATERPVGKAALCSFVSSHNCCCAGGETM